MFSITTSQITLKFTDHLEFPKIETYAIYRYQGINYIVGSNFHFGIHKPYFSKYTIQKIIYLQYNYYKKETGQLFTIKHNKEEELFEVISNGR